MFRHILVVCVGNICRSPTAEILLRERGGPDARVVQSAGLGALEGAPMDPMAQQVLAEHGYDGSDHLARQLDLSMIRDADLILAMEPAHVEELTRRAPYARGRVMLMGRWVEPHSIADPYRQERPAFEHAYALISDAVDAWLPYL